MTYSNANYLSQEFQKTITSPKNVLRSGGKIQTNWEYCIEDTIKAMGFAVGAMFVREKFSDNSKDVVS